MGGPRCIEEISAEAAAAAAALRGVIAGTVSTSPLRRWLYSVDASIYRVIPELVVQAAAPDDLIAVAAVAAEHGLPVTARGAATSLAGQAIGPGILVDCFRLQAILGIDPGSRVARVQPGVVQADLNRVAATFGLEFGPDTSTIDAATIGGMVANNSSGSRSIVYGESIDKVVRVAAVLAGGEGVVFGQCRGNDLTSGLRGPGAVALGAGLAGVRERFGDAIAAGLRPAPRWTTGYHLRELLSPEPNLARLLAGSEGTLALFTEIEVALDPRPASRVGAALTFPSLRAALSADLPILETGPSAVEMLDLVPLRRAPNLATFVRMAPLLAGGEAAMLTVEYQGSPDEAHAGLARLRSLAGELNATQVAWLDDSDALAEAAALRRAALPLLMGAPGADRPATFVEDTAVAPERLGDYVEEFQRIVAAHGVRASFTGHASAGCLHVRPLLDLKSATGVRTMELMAAEVGDLVARYHGAVSGEHGCGRARSWLLPRVLGAGLYDAMVALKEVFDPRGLLGPGVIVDGPGVAESLRLGADYEARLPWRPRLSFAQEGGLDLAVEKCFGAGLCKKSTGTMCPPAAASRDEAVTTRARANALQGLLCGAVPLGEIDGAEFAEVLGTCVACKACKTECPAGVDMAALKVEWLAARQAAHGVPPLSRGIAAFRRLGALAAPAAPLVDRAAGSRLVRRLTRLAGVAPERPLPAFASRPLTRRLGRGARRPVPASGGSVVLFADCFVQYQEPGIGEAFAGLMAAGGSPVEVLDAGCCGRTALSTGQIEKARACAARAVGPMLERVREGARICFVEPSCLAMIIDDWARLLPGDERVREVAAAAIPALAAVAELAESGALRFRPGGVALLHEHCHAKALGFASATTRVLACVPELRLEVLDAGCCGMAGVFGYEAEHYETSVAIGERVLAPAVRGAEPATSVLATGTSCRSQIADLTGRAAVHPLAFLHGRLDG